MYMDVSRENSDLKLVIQQFKTENERLYNQVNLLNEHWKGELNKVNDELFDLKKPCLSASITATNDTSGKSKPSLKRLMPTSTSNSPNLKSRKI